MVQIEKIGCGHFLVHFASICVHLRPFASICVHFWSKIGPSQKSQIISRNVQTLTQTMFSSFLSKTKLGCGSEHSKRVRIKTCPWTCPWTRTTCPWTRFLKNVPKFINDVRKRLETLNNNVEC